MRGPARFAAGVMALACAGALAQAAADGPSRRAVEQKEALVRRLVTDSPAEQRIAASGNAEAKAQFDRAREQHARAVALVASGSLKEAEAELNAAMWAVGKARQLVPDAASRAVADRVRYAALQRTVEGLAASYESNLARSRGQARGTAASDDRLSAARARLDEARGLAASEHLAQAIGTLEKAERELLRALSSILGSTEIRYAAKFDTPADEYAWELDRNRSFADLVPVAIAELKPRREAVALVDRYVGENRRHLDAAAAHATERQYARALDAVRAGTHSLQAALAAAGLATPKDTSSP